MEQTQVARPNPTASVVSRAIGFLTSVRAEMQKVNWPTRDELIKATRMVVGLSIVLGIIIGLLDLALQLILVRGIALIAR